MLSTKVLLVRMLPFRVLRTGARVGIVFTALITVVPGICSEVRQIRHFSFGPWQPSWSLADLQGRFSQQVLAVTRSGDLLSFSSRRNGTWELVRVRGWSTGQPAVDHLPIPGYFSSHDQHDLEDLQIRIDLTPDGNRAVCMATAEWLKRVSGRAVGKARMDSIIAVIDLVSFRLENKTDTKDLDLLEFQSVHLDSKGRVLITSSVFGEKPHSELVVLQVPSLHSSPRCIYETVKRDGNREEPVPITTEQCKLALSAEPLEEYLKAPQSATPAAGFICKDTKADYCPEPHLFAPDGRFGLGIRNEGHDNLLGSWVLTRSTAILFSTATHREVGEVDLTHQSLSLVLASVDGEDFLHSVGGTEVTVYQLSDPESMRR